MPRDLVVGNGQILVTLDRELCMRDLYYPYVGLWNHIGGGRSRLGVWVDGRFSWLSSPSWTRRLGYEADALVTDVEARSDELGLAVEMHDAVHFQENVFLRRMELRNLWPQSREVRVFLHHDLSIDETDVGDTAVYDPGANVVYHYKRDRYFMIDGLSPQGGMHQYATGVKRFRGAEGTWRDAEDGRLEGNPVAQGSVDSTVSFQLRLPPGGRETLWYWIAVGRSYGQTLRLDHLVRSAGPDALLAQIRGYWHQWVRKAPADFADLPEEAVRLYRRSLLLMRAHVDRTGAITAANDSDILQYNRDHYSYVWPRDGAWVALALVRAGYPELAAPFFAFCARALTAGGFLLQKYNPDGSAGSCWHPWIHQGTPQLPIQEDETALVLWAFWAHYRRTRDIELVLSLTPTLVNPAAEFLARYQHPDLGLPQESYDLWEERRGIHAWTAACVVAALEAAAHLAALVGDGPSAERYREAARRVRRGILEHLYHPGLGRFVRTAWPAGDGVRTDPTPDASIAGLHQLGVLAADDPRLAATMQQLEEALWVRTPVGGMARYRGDDYFRTTDDRERVPGNPWFITTLWLADWYASCARSPADLARARDLIAWACRHAMPSGVLPEQLEPFAGTPLSVAPLAWSHASFVLSVLRYVARHRELNPPADAGRKVAAEDA
jgi:GH15 family glucan-1,4-alpha-glucosidase